MGNCRSVGHEGVEQQLHQQKNPEMQSLEQGDQLEEAIELQVQWA
jgi:hypothetical protein